jgi:ribosomal protein S12 methylthiotransferase accessory factor
LQGFFELVERDAVALWWYSQSKRPAVDLKGFGDPYFAELEAHYRALGYKIWVLDLTTDLGIPAFTAIGAGPSQRLIIGFGCHFEARLGVQRALTELNQLYITDMPRPGAWKSIAPETLAYLFPDPSVPRLSASAYVPRGSDDILTDVLVCVERAAGAGMETLAIDLTRPDVGFTAVKVIVPGLRHFWPRFGPGRLYEVPALLGWVEGALREEDLNPLPIFW